MLNTKCSQIISKYWEVWKLYKIKDEYIQLAMSNLVIYFQFNVDSPDAHRVILIPKETTLYTRWKRPHGKASILEKGFHAWKQQIKTNFAGPSVSKQNRSWTSRTPGHGIGPFAHNPSNVWASNLCFSAKFDGIQIVMNSMTHEFGHCLMGFTLNAKHLQQWSKNNKSPQLPVHGGDYTEFQCSCTNFNDLACLTFLHAHNVGLLYTHACTHCILLIRFEAFVSFCILLFIQIEFTNGCPLIWINNIYMGLMGGARQNRMVILSISLPESFTCFEGLLCTTWAYNHQ